MPNVYHDSVLIGKCSGVSTKPSLLTTDIVLHDWKPMTGIGPATASSGSLDVDKLVARNIETFLIATVLSFGGQLSVTDIELSKVDFGRHRIVLEKTTTGLMVATVTGELT